MTQIHSPVDHVLSKPSLAPAVRSTAANGVAVNRSTPRVYTAAKVVLHVGAHDRTDTNETLDVKVQGSLDGSTNWTDITGAAFAQIGNVVPTATSGNVYTLDLNLKDVAFGFLRAVGTPGGTTPSTAYSVTFELYNPDRKPVLQDATPVRV